MLIMETLCFYANFIDNHNSLNGIVYGDRIHISYIESVILYFLSYVLHKMYVNVDFKYYLDLLSFPRWRSWCSIVYS